MNIKLIKIYLYFFQNIYSIIIKLNFEKLPHEYSNNELSNIELLHLSNIFTNITLGTPSKTIKAYIQFKYYQYFIIDKNNLNFYYKNLSKSFIPNPKEKIEFKESLFLKGYYCTEIFTFKNIENKEIKIDNIQMILAIESNLEYPCYLGFNFESEKYEDDDRNLINELKQSKKIKYDIFSFEFLNENSGEIIIGELPHNYNSSFYNEKDLKWNNIYLENYKNWNIFFTKIYFDNEKYEGSTICYLEYELNMIYAPIEYKNKLMETFIKDNKNKCKEIINLNKHYFYVCDIDVSFKKFPKILFNSSEFNFIFELDEKDLFSEINGKLYFLVDFNHESRKFSRWKLGIPFLKKYKFLFNLSKKSIGYYNMKQNKKIFSLFLIIILIIIIICLLIVIYKVRIIKRKKRLNEIDDNYKYIINNI